MLVEKCRSVVMMERSKEEEVGDILQDEMERIFRRCELEELLPLAQEMEIVEDETADKSKKAVLRVIQEHLDVVDKAQRFDLFNTLLPKFPERMRGPVEQILKDATGEASAKSKAPVVDGSTTTGGFEEQVLELQAKLDQIKASEKTEVKASPSRGTLFAGTRLFQRDFKIVGTVGAVNTKEALNYISLCSQIVEGSSKGYPPEEIAMAVRKSVCAGTPLRTYLDSKPSMPLEDVVSVVRSYLKEKTSSELFQALTNLAQRADEDAQSFMLRALELRQKVIVSSKIEGSMRFNPEIVGDAFKHTVKTGVRSDHVRAKLDKILSTPTVKDEDVDNTIMQILNLAMSEEEEKMIKQKKIAKVNAATASETGGDITSTLQKTVNSLVTQMKAMQKVMEAPRNEVASYWPKRSERQRSEWPPCESDGYGQNQSQAGQPQSGGQTGGQATSRKEYQQKANWKKKGCQKCTASGKSGCYHCWKCGEDGHFSRQCPQNSLNRDALPARGDGL